MWEKVNRFVQEKNTPCGKLGRRLWVEPAVGVRGLTEEHQGWNPGKGVGFCLFVCLGIFVCLFLEEADQQGQMPYELLCENSVTF